MNSKIKERFSFIPTSKVVEDSALEISRNRLAVVLVATCFVFIVLVFRLFEISLSNSEDIKVSTKTRSTEFFVQRASITDRNGAMLAVNLSTASLYANPNEIIGYKETAAELCKNLEIKKCSDLVDILKPGKSFVWIKRHLTPKEQQAVNDLGLPGLYFIREEKRVYPHNNLFSHILGFVDLDGNGISGVERQFDEYLSNNNKPLQLALDIRVQEVLREELAAQAQLHNAIGASGIVMDANTGEVVAMASLPDFDPNHAGNAKERQRFNQVTLGVYEMGSTFKVLTTAMGIDGNFIRVNDAFNTDATVMVGNHKISDYKGKGGFLSVPEILMYSSNIGTAQIGMKVGVSNQKKYLNKFGLMQPLDIELPEKSRSLYPSDKRWSQASLITISYGHGISVTPLHTVRAFASVVNGGKLFKPTLLKVDSPEDLDAEQILNRGTSETMRKMLRLVVTGGSGRKANADGYVVAGKTGTAEKIVGNRYSKKSNIALFICAFPIDDPKYVVMVMIDEAKANSINGGYTTGGTLAAPVAGNVISRIAPILGVKPRKAEDPEIQEKLSLVYEARYKKPKN